MNISRYITALSRLHMASVLAWTAVGAIGTAAVASACSGPYQGCASSNACASTAASGDEGGDGSSVDVAGGPSASVGAGGDLNLAGGAGASSGGQQGGPPPGMGGEGGGGGDAASPVFTPIHVIGYPKGTPVAKARVFVNDSDGAFVFETDTDVQGNCGVNVPPGGSVSAAWVKTINNQGKPYVSRDMTTVFEPAPGAEVTLIVDDPSDVAPATTSTMKISVKLTTNVAGVTSRELVSCQWGAGAGADIDTFTDDKFAGCVPDSTFDIYGFVSDKGGVLAFASALDVPFVNGGSYVKTLNATNTNLSTHRLKVSPIPPGTSTLSFGIYAYRPGRTVPFGRDARADPPNVDETLEVKFPVADFKTFVQHGFAVLTTAPLRKTSGFSRTGASPSDTRSWAPTQLASFDTQVGVELSEPARPAISWSLDNAGTLADGVEARLQWGTYPAKIYWAAIKPVSRTGTVKVPELPRDIMDLAPKADDEIDVSLRHLDLVLAEGYPAFVAQRAYYSNDNYDWSTVEKSFVNSK